MPTLNLYGIPNCDRVKKARNWLEIHSIEYLFCDLKKIDISKSLLHNWLTQSSHEKLINRAGATWRGLDADTKSNLIDEVALIDLMQNKPSVIKRPILERDGKIIAVGFDMQLYDALFKVLV